MRLTWKEIDRWREQRGMQKADLAREAGIPESTIYRGIRHDSRLQPSMKKIMQTIFPKEFEEMGRGR